MEVRKGFKITEVGIIPEDWEFRLFGDVITGFSSGATPYRGRPEFYKGNTKWITSGELNYNLITDSQEKISQEAVNRTNLKIHPEGTFLIAITGLEAAGTRGRCGIVGSPSSTNQSCMALFPVKGVLENKYLYHYYIWQGDNLAFKYCQGTKQQSYTANIAKRLPIICPPLPEQQAIAEVLSDTDNLIQALEKQIAKKRLIKQGVMQKLLTPRDGWEKKELKSCLIESPKYGIGAAAVDYSTDLPTYLRITDISDEGNVLKNDLKSVNHPDSEKYFLEEGDIVFARTGASVGKSYLYDKKDGHFVFAGFLIKIRPNPSTLNPSFLKILVSTKSYWNWVAMTSMRSGQPGINGHEYSSLVISLPTLTEQIFIAQIITDIENEIEVIEKKLSKYKSFKQGLMQNLLTGKIRLKA
jgi:type I restriction enzyme S subunit